MATTKIDKSGLSFEQATEIVFAGRNLVVDDEILNGVYRSFYFLKEFIRDKVIYGINTGFGPMAQYKIENENQIQLQYNLIRSHCSGLGEPIGDLNSRAVLLCRMNTLALGYSGIHPDVILLMNDLLNKNIHPVIYAHGGLGASGDLVQLAHLSLALLGEGEVHFSGKIVNSADVFSKEHIKPMQIHIREGLGLMNGTSAMCGIGLVNLFHSFNLLELAIATSSWLNELCESYDDHFSEELNQAKLHPGQRNIATAIREKLSSSQLIKKREKYLYNKPVTENVLKDKLQEYYSVRCVPQVLGPIADTIKNAREIVMQEINSANDNPIIDYKNYNVFHGGNFHGDYVALEMDKLRIAMAKLSMLAERQLNFLLNDKLNGKFPPFLNLGQLGFNLGVQGIQFTATSTVAENQTLSNPLYIHSIPSNNDNQDIVSMGSNSALLTQRVIFNSYEVMSILLVALAQATDCSETLSRLSNSSRELYQIVRNHSQKIESDLPSFRELRNLTEGLKNRRFY